MPLSRQVQRKRSGLFVTLLWKFIFALCKMHSTSTEAPGTGTSVTASEDAVAAACNELSPRTRQVYTGRIVAVIESPIEVILVPQVIVGTPFVEALRVSCTTASIRS
ncbi:hypothetical protein BO79DRAFT_209067 [Aspergillus costaricaensis CBS 115574]|uniref:Uncharacterized protein n=1 Tax=Aspergillus costaricaensis CBS 115574 TaxID=1448317 RepID=A0ACD1IF96_9EURO|nr:hypothetical protein BO79DRAFT_209067 [Aspergillus costaricaensis CBS 115574]RAK88997.1 hypothetical protein BO79DRAFT_209067 [Aspergillus costaricaensis CBS 115574]